MELLRAEIRDEWANCPDKEKQLELWHVHRLSHQLEERLPSYAK